MSDQVAISGEFCTLLFNAIAIAATRKFDMKIDLATYGNFVARGTSKWRTNYAADIGATLDFDGLIVTQATCPNANQFDDLFTAIAARTSYTAVFTLKSSTTGEPQFIYSCSVIIKSLSTNAPQFGEATYACSLLVTGAVTQTTGTVS